jgi:hypothetical protein
MDNCCVLNYRTGSCDCVIPVDKFIRGDRPKYNLSYRCPWCQRTDNDQIDARVHSLRCDKKTLAVWEHVEETKREMKKIAKV